MTNPSRVRRIFHASGISAAGVFRNRKIPNKIIPSHPNPRFKNEVVVSNAIQIAPTVRAAQSKAKRIALGRCGPRSNHFGLG